MTTYKFKITGLNGYEGTSCKITNFNNERFVVMYPDGSGSVTIEPNLTDGTLVWEGRATTSCYLWDSNGGVVGSPLFYLSKAYHGSEDKSVGIISYINENGEFINYTSNNVNLEFTVSDTPAKNIKTSSRLGGVIRRVKNRISNLCENRMEVAYGS